MGRRKNPVNSEGRRRHRRVLSLQKYLKAYGRGEEGRLWRESFAARVGTSLPYLVHVGLGNRRVSMELALRIDKATYGQVAVEDLCPQADWDYIRSKRNGGAVRHA